MVPQAVPGANPEHQAREALGHNQKQKQKGKKNRGKFQRGDNTTKKYLIFLSCTKYESTIDVYGTFTIISPQTTSIIYKMI